MDEENQEKNEKVCTIEDIKKLVKSKILGFEDIDVNNLELMYKLVDIYKDLENVDYWKIKKEVYKMRYDEGNYNEYGRQGMRGTGPYSRYRGGRGSGRYSYRGDDAMDEMRDHYMNYNEGREQYDRGNYNGGEQEMVESAEGIMRNVTEIVKELADSDNPQVMQVIQKHARKIMEM